MKGNILIVSQYFYPEQFRINDISQELIKRGYKVTVLTGIPNYPYGRFYKGYGFFQRRKEYWNGINIIRIPLIPRGEKSISLILNYISFVISGFIWSIFTNIKFDKVFIFEVSPMTQALPAIWYSRRRKIPAIIYVQDLWPENVEIVAGIHNRYLITGINKMVDYIYKYCSKILVSSPSFKKNIETRGIKEGNVIYWPQYAEKFYHPEIKEELFDLKEDNIFKIVYTGNIGYAQGLDILPKVAVILKQMFINIKFIIIGNGRYIEEFEKEIKKYKVETYFKLLGSKKPIEIPKYLSLCDAAFLSFAKNDLFEMTIPAKLQSYMASGIPILAAAGGETKRIIEEAGCGIVCNMGDVDGLCKNILYLMNIGEDVMKKMRNNALLYSEERFNVDNLMSQLCEILEETKT